MDKFHLSSRSWGTGHLSIWETLCNWNLIFVAGPRTAKHILWRCVGIWQSSYPKDKVCEPRDRNRWNVFYCAPSQVFLLRRAIELLHAFVRQNVHPLTATTFGNWLSPRARAHYHKSRISRVGSNDNSFLVRLWWNLDYSNKGSSQRSKWEAPVFFHPRHGHSVLGWI